MNDDIIRMAREAGLYTILNEHAHEYGNGYFENTPYPELERFAELVIKPWADQLEVERKRFQELNDVAALGMQHARAAEREACAKVCESRRTPGTGSVAILNGAADAIRARGNT